MRFLPPSPVGFFSHPPPPPAGPPPPPPPVGPDEPPAGVGRLGHELTGALARFIRATDTDADRHVLAPLALRETAYRVLRTGQGAALAEAAYRENAGDRISAAIAFMRNELDKPIKVEDMANHVSMPVSTFAHLFKASTGSAPYQYLKRLRLDRARALLVEENRAVSEACEAVGYSTVSHFISEFKRTYGETPRAYASRLRRLGMPHSPLADEQSPERTRADAVQHPRRG
ncbi:MAG: helix-turn-helix domain-containing protein [bacterium]|nr:helix-turn-helix domain-containing protein [bacterium]